MWKQLTNIFKIPFDPLDEKKYKRNILSSMIHLGFFILAIFLAPTLIAYGFLSPQSGLVIGMLLVLILARLAMNKWGTRAVSIFLVISGWLFINGVCLFLENGLRAPAYTAATAFLLIYVGLVHGRLTLLAVTVVSILTAVLVGILELQGIFLTAPHIPDIRWTLVIWVILFPTMAYMIAGTLTSLQESISLYREESEQRHRSELEVKKLNLGLEQAYGTTLEGWAKALELRDKETEGHSRRVTELTMELARNFGVETENIKYIYYGALLHDIGKMGIPDEILNKPGELTAGERLIVNKHPEYAQNLLKDIEYLKPAISIPYSHHENWDGTGYPQGLKGDAIPLPARLFAVVDNWDALTSDRPYRLAWSHEKTIRYIKEQSGLKFDPSVVAAFLDKITS